MPKLVTEYWGLTFEWLFLVATGIIAVVLWLPSFGWSVHLWNWVVKKLFMILWVGYSKYTINRLISSEYFSIFDVWS